MGCSLSVCGSVSLDGQHGYEVEALIPNQHTVKSCVFQALFVSVQSFWDQHLFDGAPLLAYFQVGVAVCPFEFVMQARLDGLFIFRIEADFSERISAPPGRVAVAILRNRLLRCSGGTNCRVKFRVITEAFVNSVSCMSSQRRLTGNG